VEAGLAFDAFSVGVERDALRCDGGIEFEQGVEVLVGDGLVDVDPECFGGLQLRRLRRQVDEPDSFRHGEAGGGVPAGAVQHEQDEAVAPGTGLAGEERERLREELLVDAGREVPEALSGRGRDEGGEAKAPMAVPTADSQIESELAGGHRMRISGSYDPEALARLIRGLSM
jgi:hypothetical protein